ncbi:hypothetical protein BC749_10984 [Flavobacterium araucananum]|uniref:Uncharacterized protein n=1 Tax=Flavobacterium araucananum TaxID=946678 RepID=A0A227P562_9FLAO|nr:DUF6069 family protein [Flavobacterium araucananum]OXG05090.1 hypothetical protein B0A64_13760 [Flavobacterium araucananum]PWJ96807.1 hypothetical protein BC749_10984 [Flavobacterium araucananum]
MNSKLNFKKSIIAGLYAAGAAAIINAILFFIFHRAGIISDNIFPNPNEPLTVVPVIMASIIPIIIGSILFFLIEKFTNKGFIIFTIVAVILVLLSLLSPFTVIPNVTVGYALILCAMHLIAAVVLIYFLSKSIKSLLNSKR